MAKGEVEITIRLSDGQEVADVVRSAIDVVALTNLGQHMEVEVATHRLQVALQRLAPQCSPDLARKVEQAIREGRNAVPHVVP